MGSRRIRSVDVGAHHGDWTAEARRTFPSARFFLVDADPANAPVLESVCGTLPNCRFAITLLGPESRENVRFYQMGTGFLQCCQRGQPMNGKS